MTQKLLTWGVGLGAGAFLIIWLASSSQSFPIRIATSLLASMGGLIAGILLGLVVTEDGHDESATHS